jgi:hypothetical protein
MIKVENIDTWGFEHAIRGMRNPLNSWSRSDSSFEDYVPDYAMDTARTYPCVKIGENDLKLMRQLYVGGQPHRKYLRQIFVVMDITAPLYWWKEFDTYKVGTTANSCSTMHKIAAKEFTVEDFSVEHLLAENTVYFGKTIERLNNARNKFLETKDKRYWRQMIQLLPSSYNQRRTVSMTYENVMNMLDYREGHKLDEWREFCKILKQLPYVEVIRDGKKERT